ncbi:hypothetical protein SLEP1_g9879 [Rubroshorea leprosula]|uniref:Uncharacterized protein n=1 Tax=Rubroshorea leprosula TaxID=152421 RepID=A0AAV5I6A4_9ROSI|nr:hypothetical protein SLEP1_g9879 [Rubroshorea leprosula]
MRKDSIEKMESWRASSPPCTAQILCTEPRSSAPRPAPLHRAIIAPSHAQPCCTSPAPTPLLPALRPDRLHSAPACTLLRSALLPAPALLLHHAPFCANQLPLLSAPNHQPCTEPACCTSSARPALLYPTRCHTCASAAAPNQPLCRLQPPTPEPAQCCAPCSAICFAPCPALRQDAAHFRQKKKTKEKRASSLPHMQKKTTIPDKLFEYI